MDDIIKAMRVLAEEYSKCSTDTSVPDLKILFAWQEVALISAANRLERESKPEVKCGCHCDIDGGMPWGGCVIDYGRPEDCDFAQTKYKRKEDCEHWQPIKIIG